MPSYESDDVFGSSSSHFLAPPSASPRKSPSRTRSTASLRGPSNLTLGGGDPNAATGQHSLAHELAVALMPEPSAGSKLLAEEFGIDYDEGAEGIDEEVESESPDLPNRPTPSFADELGSQPVDKSFGSGPSSSVEAPSDYDRDFRSPMLSHRAVKQPEQDAMKVLAQNLESTDNFLAHLRQIDIDSTLSTNQPSLENLASEVIRRLNETTRDRETQLRELLGYDREFRKIAGEVGGGDVLGQLDELVGLGDLSDNPVESHHKLGSVNEEPSTLSQHLSAEWEMDPDQLIGDEDNDFDSDSPSPIKDSFPPPPPINGPMTISKAVPQMAHIRSFTTSLVSSLTTLSEHAQVNGAATTEAGRKIRALKNKVGGWRSDWDGAERSRVRIERWEAGIPDSDLVSGNLSTPPRTSRRIDGRKLVKEHLQAFELALAEAGQKTQAIMAAS